MERLTFKERIQNGQTIGMTILLIITSLILLTKTQALFGEFGTYVIIMALIYTLGGLSVNLITGYCGQLSLGQAGFFAVGAYAAGIFARNMASTGLPTYVIIIGGIVVGAIVAGVFGYFIGLPTLRLSGDYLAIVTLGFAEIIRIAAKNMSGLTGGGIGLDNIPKFSKNSTEGTFVTFLWVLAVFLIVVFFLMMLIRSGSGRRIIAVREDEIAANAMGINIKRNKQNAFVLASVVAGIGGAIFSFTQGSINPATFQFQLSVDFLIIAVFGGLGSFSGTIISGLVLTIINQGVLPSIKGFAPFFIGLQSDSSFLNPLWNFMAWVLNNVQDLRLLIYALILIIVMVYRPKGLLGTKEWSIKRFWNRLFGIEKTYVEDGGVV